MITIYKLSNKRLNYEYFFYSMAGLRSFQAMRMGDPILDDIIEETELNETIYFIDKFHNIRIAAKCEFYVPEDDEDSVSAYEGTLYLGRMDREDFDKFGLRLTIE